MSADLLLGLDIGTQAVKGVIVRKDGEIIAQAGCERAPTHPHPGWAEMDAERDWWGTVLVVLRDLLASENVHPEKIAAIGVSALACCLCPLDKENHPLRPAIIYSDNRALDELEWVNQQAGLSLTAEAVVPKLKWLQRREPEIFESTRKVVSANNYVVYRLTGELSMDYDNASIMGGIFDAVNKVWKTELSENLGIPGAIWPPPFPATGIVGHVTREAARITGLRAGIPVIAGSGDTFPTIVGCGAVEPGDAMIAFGTTGLLTFTNRPLVESAQGPHFDANIGSAAVSWGANVLSAGRLVQWYRDNFSESERTVARRLGDSEFSLIEAGADRVPPGSEGLIVLPHWLGRRTPTPDSNLRGAIIGLTPSHSASHIYRSILEAFAYNVKQGFEPLRPRIQRLAATAGGARSSLWRQIMSNVLEIPLEYHPGASGSLGIAFMAGYAVGMVKDFCEIKTRWLVDPYTTSPQPEAMVIYRDMYNIYCEFDKALQKPFANLAKITHL